MTDAAYDDATEIAKQVVAELAPDELELFDQTADATRDRAPGGRRSADELLGFGIEAVESMVTVAALAGSKAALGRLAEEAGKAAGAKAAERAKGWFGKVRRRQAASSVALPVTLTTEQLAAVRSAAVAQIATFGLPEQRSSQIADAIVGRLALRGADSAEDVG